MEECDRFINIKRESRHLKTFELQRIKFERLCHKYKKTKGGHSNINGNHVQTSTATASDSNLNASPNSTNSKNTWVRNISSTPLTEAQEKCYPMGWIMLWLPDVHRRIDSSGRTVMSTIKTGEGLRTARGGQGYSEEDTTPLVKHHQRRAKSNKRAEEW